MLRRINPEEPDALTVDFERIADRRLGIFRA